MIILFLSSMMTGSFSGVRAQEVTARAGIDTSSILLGQQVTLKLNVTLPKGRNIIWPVFTDSLAAGVEIVSISGIDSVISADQLSLSQRLRISSFDTGFHQIPPIPFYEKMREDSLAIVAVTNELFLTVNTVPVDTTKAIKDVKGVMAVPLTFREIFRWVLLGLGILALGAGSWYYFRKKRKRLPVFALAPKPETPPHLIALDEFEKLRQARLWQSGKIKEYYTQLIDILRVYLEKRFHIQAMEMTSDEILGALRSVAIVNEAREVMIELLTLADLVKFAKEQPLPMQHDQCLKLGIDFVNLTRAVINEAENQQLADPTTSKQEQAL